MDEELLKKNVENQGRLVDEFIKAQDLVRKQTKIALIFSSVKWVLGLVLFFFLISSFQNLTDIKEEFEEDTTRGHIGLLKITEPIMADSEFASFDSISKKLESIYRKKNLKAIVISINSPGGSPVQSSMIYNRILAKKKEFPDIKVYAMIQDVGASGAYYIASATDKIIANHHSIVGSIGVIMSQYNVKKALDYLNIERKTQKSGKYKDILDPTKGEVAFEKEFVQRQLDGTHKQFIKDVKAGRGDKLKFNLLSEDMMFSGLFWNGDEALKYGLIDELGDIYTIKAEFDNIPVINYTPEASVIDKLSKKVSSAITQSLMQNNFVVE